MRLLFAVVHYYKAGDGRHGSLAADPGHGLMPCGSLILQLHRLTASRLDCSTIASGEWMGWMMVAVH